MFPEQLKKILNLIKKTGDRVVIFDGSNPDDSYVIMGFDSYADEKIAEISTVKPESAPKLEKNDNLTEEDLTDKINREISMWKNRDISPSLTEENKPKKAWAIPPQVKDKAQEVE